jgi:hypothetical protein
MGRLIKIAGLRCDPTTETSARLALAGDPKAWSAPSDHKECVTADEDFSSCPQAKQSGYVLLLIVNGAQLVVMASAGQTERPKKRFHQSCARCRRSQLPLASSQANKERTLARARAIEQSAAP